MRADAIGGAAVSLALLAIHPAWAGPPAWGEGGAALPFISSPLDATDGIGAGTGTGSTPGAIPGFGDPGTLAPGAGLPRPGMLGFPYDTLPSPPGEGGRGWTVTPSIGVQQLLTDNLYQSAQDKRSAFITTITPGLLVSIDTARLRGIVNYAPDWHVYSSEPGQTGIDQRFNGQLLATLVPDALFLDMRGSAAVQAANGGYANNQSTLDRNNQVRTTSFQISPYYVHRFGGLATMQLGYGLQHVSQDSAGNGMGTLTPGGQPFFSNQDFFAHEFYGVARTGEDFGRLAMEARASSTTYDGSGVLENAYRRIGTVEARYAISRWFMPIAEIGYEQQRYSGVPPFRISEEVWSAGAKFTLSPESSITARYGHRDGFDSARLDAVLALGGRTRLFANYAERLTTSAQRAADLLSTTTLDELGNPVDTATGAPVALPISNSFVGVQSSLMRVRTASLSLSQSWARDVLTFTFSRELSRPVSVDPGSLASRQSGTSGSLTWSHELSPGLTGIAYAQYGTFNNPGRGSGNVFGGGATLVMQLGPGLVGTLQYSITDRGDDFTSGRAIQNTIIAGLRQSF